MTRTSLGLILVAGCQARLEPAPEKMHLTTAVQAASRDTNPTALIAGQERTHLQNPFP
jgi:hypothetical protein